MTLIDEVKKVQEENRELRNDLDATRTIVDRLEEQMNGKRGVSASLEALLGEIKGLRKAAYWVAGLIVAGSVGFAFSVLQLVGT